MMKIVAICALFAVVLAGEDMTPEEKAAVDTCKGKFPSVKDDVIKEMCSPGFQTNDKDAKCFMKCWGETMGVSTPKGVLIKDVALKAPMAGFDAEKLKAGIDECAAKTASDDCETAYQQWTCLTKAAKSG